jgi:hypothetical protein
VWACSRFERQRATTCRRLNTYHDDLIQMRLELERKEMAEDDNESDNDDEDDLIGRHRRIKLT